MCIRARLWVGLGNLVGGGLLGAAYGYVSRGEKASTPGEPAIEGTPDSAVPRDHAVAQA